jgi:urease accessory protein
MKRSMRRVEFGMVLLVLATAQVALAHPGHASTAVPFVSGTLHPLLGLDHLLAALASGLLAVRVGSRRAAWVVPGVFVASMFAGSALAAGGLQLPIVEWGIALSVVVLGLTVAVSGRVSLRAAATLVGLFAVCHGYAHAAEFSGTSLFGYSMGLALATLAIHATAIAAGLLAARLDHSKLVRFAGGAIAASFLVSLLAG